MRQISIAIPNYNRTEMLLESFMKVYHDDRIYEIVISDDCSDMDKYERLGQLIESLPKVKMYRNNENADCYQNKVVSVSLCSSQYTILLDSDNTIDTDYLDVIYAYDWDEKKIITPSFAAPHFDFRQYEGLTITKETVSQYADNGIFQTMLNAANYFVNCKEYLKTYDNETDPVTSDSIYTCLRWLESGGSIFVAPGLKYLHRVHNGHYRTNVHRTPRGLHENIIQRLKDLR